MCTVFGTRVEKDLVLNGREHTCVLGVRCAWKAAWCGVVRVGLVCHGVFFACLPLLVSQSAFSANTWVCLVRVCLAS